MIPKRPISLKKALPLLLLGLLLFIVYLYFLVGLSDVALILQQLNPLHYSVAVVFLLFDLFFYALTWQFFLRPLSVKVSFRKTFLFVWIGAFADILIPAESISGDASRAYLMSRESGENAGKVVASIVGHRILSMVITLTSLIISSLSLFMLNLPVDPFVVNVIMLIMVGTAVSLVFLFLLCFREHLTWTVIDWVLRFIAYITRHRISLASLRARTQKALNAFHQSVEILGNNLRSLLIPATFSLISWLLSVFLTFFVFLSIGYPINLGILIIVHSIICSIQTVPIGVVAGVGPVDIIMSSLYSLLGVPLIVSATATVLIRGLTVWFKLFAGFVAIQWVSIKAFFSRQRSS